MWRVSLSHVALDGAVALHRWRYQLITLIFTEAKGTFFFFVDPYTTYFDAEQRVRFLFIDPTSMTNFHPNIAIDVGGDLILGKYIRRFPQLIMYYGSEKVNTNLQRINFIKIILQLPTLHRTAIPHICMIISPLSRRQINQVIHIDYRQLLSVNLSYSVVR